MSAPTLPTVLRIRLSYRARSRQDFCQISRQWLVRHPTYLAARYRDSIIPPKIPSTLPVYDLAVLLVTTSLAETPLDLWLLAQAVDVDDVHPSPAIRRFLNDQIRTAVKQIRGLRRQPLRHYPRLLKTNDRWEPT
jgi:hypothetical protein